MVADEVTRVEAVRTLEIPLDLHAVVSCGCWRMCSVESGRVGRCGVACCA
jgi:hypothetical protein